MIYDLGESSTSTLRGALACCKDFNIQPVVLYYFICVLGIVRECAYSASDGNYNSPRVEQCGLEFVFMDWVQQRVTF